MKKRVLGMALILALTLGMVGCGEKETSSAESEWKPDRTITIYCSAGAGGSTDLSNRALASAFKEYFGVAVNVVNVTGGGGGICATQVYDAEHDGYTVLGAADNMHGQGVQGSFSHPNTVWDCYMIAHDKGILCVRTDSEFETVDEVIDAAKERTINIGSSQAGNVWSVKVAQIDQAADIKLNQLPFEGSNQSVTALMSGEIDVCLVGLSDVCDYIRSGQIRPLCAVETEATTLEGYGDIPSICDSVPKFGELTQAYQWVGIALPEDTPDNVKEAYDKAWEYALNTKAVQNLSERTLTVVGLSGKEAAKVRDENDSCFAWTIYDAGLGTISPEEFGIPRP